MITGAWFFAGLVGIVLAYMLGRADKRIEVEEARRIAYREASNYHFTYTRDYLEQHGSTTPWRDIQAILFPPHKDEGDGE